jgi:hypothetical protein
MSIEEPQEPLTPDQEAAFALIRENDLLKRDPYAKRVVEMNGVVDSGIVVDIGNFIEARLAKLEEATAEAKLAAMKGRDPEAYDAAVVNSVAPHLERNIE